MRALASGGVHVSTPSARERFAAFRRSIPVPARLVHTQVTARGLSFAVFHTPVVAGATPLVCINGGMLYDHKLLWPALSPLAAKRQLILYDQRGRGRSTAPPGIRAARAEHDALDLGALRVALGLRRWDVLGHSWGGGIAMMGVEADRAGTRRLVTIDAVGPTSSWREMLEPAALARLDVAGRADLTRAAARLAADDTLDSQSAYNRAIYPAWFADREMGALFTPPRATSETGAAISRRLRAEGYDWRERLRGLDVPALIVHGERDLLPATVATDWLACLPNARVALVPNAGHMPFWEQPELLFPTIEAFLSAPDAGPP